MNILQLILVLLVLGLLAVVAMTVWGVIKQRRREAHDAERLAKARSEGLDLPASLHPVIDYARCSGCLACLDICPEGDLFGVKEGKAVMIEPSRCIGHGVCVEACPTDAITLIFGTEERGVDLPETNEFFETSREGVHIVGELAGIGLLKNALKQGLDVAKFFKDALAAEASNGGRMETEKDVAIVGAGPAGIATALGCRAMGLSFRIIDQDSIGGTVSAYPRQKVVMTEPVKLPLYGSFGRRVISKEELLGGFYDILRRAKITVHEKVMATEIQGEKGDFTVVTDKGSFTARRVVLALGKRGTPRKLEVPGEDTPKVTYALIDPTQYKGKRVLVVGGGDAALESVIMLAEEGDIDVSLSYRRDNLQRARAKNRKRVEELADDGQLQLILRSEVKEIRDDEVVLTVDGQTEVLPNDYVIVNAGGTLPTKFLEKAGVNIRRYHGEALKKSSGKGSGPDFGLSWPVTVTLYALGLASVAFFLWYGWSYYFSARAVRVGMEVHDSLKPSGDLGHGIGIVATLLMFSNFLYSGRKRRNWFASTSVRSWMTIHTFAGVVGPALVALHSAFQSNNLVATATTGAMAVVVVTGLIGRFFYRFMPMENGRPVRVGELKDEQKRLNLQLMELAADSRNPHQTGVHVTHVTSQVAAKGGVTRMLMHLPEGYFQKKRVLKRLRPEFRNRDKYRQFEELYDRMDRIRLQIIFYQRLQGFMSTWRVVHVSLALMLVVLVVVHIGVSLYLGFGWVLF